jgi:hypothetical protein
MLMLFYELMLFMFVSRLLLVYHIVVFLIEVSPADYLQLPENVFRRLFPPQRGCCMHVAGDLWPLPVSAGRYCRENEDYD